MEAYESSLSKDIFSNPIVKNTIDVYKSKHWTTVGCVFEYNGKQYEIKFADESDLVERFEKFTKQMSADVLETIENHKHQ